MAGNLADSFCSSRLTYRSIDNTDAEKDWFHNQIKSDPVAFALGDSSLLRPQLKSRSDATLESISKDLLGVVICLKETCADEDGTATSTPIGILHLSDEGSDNYRHHHRLAVLSIALTSGYRDKGYGGEAIGWATNWAFEKAGMHSVSLGCVEYNERAAHLYQKIGFVLEGRFRKSHFHQRQWWDVLLFSMLEEEWEVLKAQGAGVCRSDTHNAVALSA